MINTMENITDRFINFVSPFKFVEAVIRVMTEQKTKFSLKAMFV